MLSEVFVYVRDNQCELQAHSPSPLVQSVFEQHLYIPNSRYRRPQCQSTLAAQQHIAERMLRKLPPWREELSFETQLC